MSARTRYPAHHTRTMTRLERPDDAPDAMLAVWGSRDYFAALWLDPNGFQRLSINSTTFDSRTGRWADGLTWDELMKVKHECGFAENWSVEVYPPTSAVVNDAAMRHLWILGEAPPFAWTTQ